MVVGVMSFTATTASAVTGSGTWGDLSWSLDSRGVLLITGEGAMKSLNGGPSGSWRATDSLENSIKTVVIDEGVTSIGAYAFYGCNKLTSVIISSTVTSIGNYAFEDCFALPEISIPDSVTSIGGSAFLYCDKLTSVTIPDSVTSIGSSAFFECDKLTSVSIGSGVTTIGANAFRSCPLLTEIDVAEDNAYYCDIDGVLFNEDVTTLIQYPIGKTDEAYTVPSGVTTIGTYSFYSAKKLTSIVMPKSVTTVEAYAFYSASNIATVYYTGTQLQWLKVYIAGNNSPLTGAAVVYDYAINLPFTFAGDADTTHVAIDDTKGYLSFSAGGMSVDDVKALFVDTDLSFVKASGSVQVSGTVGTGTVITSTIDGESKSYTVVVLGDVTGDGRIAAADYNKVVSAVYAKTTLEGAFFAAADVVTPSAGRLAANDYAKIKSFISNKATEF